MDELLISTFGPSNVHDIHDAYTAFSDNLSPLYTGYDINTAHTV